MPSCIQWYGTNQVTEISDIYQVYIGIMQFVTYMLRSFVEWMLPITIGWHSDSRVFQKDSLDGILPSLTYTNICHICLLGAAWF